MAVALKKTTQIMRTCWSSFSHGQQAIRGRRINLAHKVFEETSISKLDVGACWEMKQLHLHSEFPLSLLPFPAQHLDGSHGTVCQGASVDHPEPSVADGVRLPEPIRRRLKLPVREDLASLFLGWNGNPRFPP